MSNDPHNILSSAFVHNSAVPSLFQCISLDSNKAIRSSLFDFVPLAGYFRTISSLVHRLESGIRTSLFSFSCPCLNNGNLHYIKRTKRHKYLEMSVRFNRLSHIWTRGAFLFRNKPSLPQVYLSRYTAHLIHRKCLQQVTRFPLT